MPRGGCMGLHRCPALWDHGYGSMACFVPPATGPALLVPHCEFLVVPHCGGRTKKKMTRSGFDGKLPQHAGAVCWGSFATMVFKLVDAVASKRQVYQCKQLRHWRERCRPICGLFAAPAIAFPSHFASQIADGFLLFCFCLQSPLATFVPVPHFVYVSCSVWLTLHLRLSCAVVLAVCRQFARAFFR